MSESENQNWHFDTLAIHAGQSPDPSTGAIMTPIYQTSTYVQAGPAQHKGYEYSRTDNPTRKALEDCLAALEAAPYGLAFASGMAAIDTIFKMLRPGDHVVAGNDVNGGTFRLADKVLTPYGVNFSWIDLMNLDTVRAAIRPETRLIWIETPTNPRMGLVDIAALVEIARAHKILVAVDNTFASPAIQQPLVLGADLAVHSTTKYLGGHSDVIQGCLVMNDDPLREKLYFLQKSCGAVPGPMDCFLVLRGIKTLHVRMKQHCENGAIIANWLRNHSKIKHVYWCGFEDHPGYAIAKKQMRDFGGMMSFTLKDDSMETAFKLLSSTKLFALAESLGGVESLINHPASMTHASIPREERIKNGLSDSLIRLSVGIEDAGDLIEDLKQAIEK